MTTNSSSATKMLENPFIVQAELDVSARVQSLAILRQPCAGMSLHDEKAAALAEVLAATGEEIVWNGRTLHALVSDNPLSQDLGLGGFSTKGDCTVKILRSELGADRPKFGETVAFQGATYRITRVTDHPQFPMIVLVVEPVD